MATKAKTFKCELVKAKDFSSLVFSASLARGGYWSGQLNLLRNDPEGLLKIRNDDASSLTQLRTKAKKEGLELLFARDGEFVFIRAVIRSDAQARLALLLREPRTINELQSKNLELNLEAELRAMAARGQAIFRKGSWQLTQNGTI